MLNVILGLIGLSIIVVIHEFGHFLAARANGVEVEAFSLGWGPTLLSAKRGRTEWKLSAFPLGGYCKMKGEDAFKTALEQNLPTLPKEEGSFYSASPTRRIGILAAGPIMNFVFAIVLSTIVALVGTQVQTISNKIILASEYGGTIGGNTEQNVQNPADIAGLRTGDIITKIDDVEIKDYSDLQRIIAMNGGKTLHMTVLRDGTPVEVTITPRLDKATGQGLIGIYGWVDPVVESVEKGSAAAIAGLESGDVILEVDGKPVNHSIDLAKYLENQPERINLTIQRGTERIEKTLVLTYTDRDPKTAESNLGIVFKTITKTTKASSLADAILMGANTTWETFVLSIKSIGLLFSGIDVFSAVSGPARITYMVGASASESFKQSGIAGILPVLSFLALISVSLGFMNLLPIPALDGGQIVLCLVEIVNRKPLKVRTLYRYQSAGSIIVLALIIVATMSDVLFFFRR